MESGLRQIGYPNEFIGLGGMFYVVCGVFVSLGVAPSFNLHFLNPMASDLGTMLMFDGVLVVLAAMFLQATTPLIRKVSWMFALGLVGLGYLAVWWDIITAMQVGLDVIGLVLALLFATVGLVPAIVGLVLSYNQTL